MKRLEEDKPSTQEQVNAKEAELFQAREDAENLIKKKHMLDTFLVILFALNVRHL